MGFRKKIRVQQPSFDMEERTGHDSVDKQKSCSSPGPENDLDREIVEVVQFARDVISELTIIYADKDPVEGCTLFVQDAVEQYDKILLCGSNFARDIWVTGSVQIPLSHMVSNAIKDWMFSAPASTLERSVCSRFFFFFFANQSFKASRFI